MVAEVKIAVECSHSPGVTTKGLGRTVESVYFTPKHPPTQQMPGYGLHNALPLTKVLIGMHLLARDLPTVYSCTVINGKILPITVE